MSGATIFLNPSFPDRGSEGDVNPYNVASVPNTEFLALFAAAPAFHIVRSPTRGCLRATWGTTDIDMAFIIWLSLKSRSFERAAAMAISVKLTWS